MLAPYFLIKRISQCARPADVYLLVYLISLCFFQSLLKTCATFLLLYDGRNKTIIKKFHCIRVECFSRTLAWMKPNTKAIPLLHKTGGYSISQNECFVGEKHIRVGDDGKEYTLTFTCEQGNRQPVLQVYLFMYIVNAAHST